MVNQYTDWLVFSDEVSLKKSEGKMIDYYKLTHVLSWTGQVENTWIRLQSLIREFSVYYIFEKGAVVSKEEIPHSTALRSEWH